ncbi:hypothetical protein OBBRIDRAFT_795700 [Obba rivulosa]|uniref:AB hydrolase-1 domain-containing protein n=1 Tax=Obba rivulosa TaxID=1052685 RepID=A0A8E2AYU0_9APHY|nr:hypothetical protein OBBRIDRAFT_795700 [Obba rivulosa]
MSRAVRFARAALRRNVQSTHPSVSTPLSRGNPRKPLSLPKETRRHPDHLATSGLGWRETVLSSGLFSVQPSSEGPTLWLAFAAALGLPAALWLYKCLMMVIFQRKIIYMGYAPPGARTEELGRDVPVPQAGIVARPEAWAQRSSQPEVVLIYLQGNAGNPIGRIPVFERLFHGLSSRTVSRPHPASNVAVVAVAPRSYWKSSSRTPTERGLLADYHSVLSYTTQRFPNATVILYGHSLGGAIAVCLAARLRGADFPNVRGLVLENPFASIPGMVEALYPQRWLPYRYLTPFAFDRWDAVAAMRKARNAPGSLLERLSRNMLVMLSEKDEMVPPTMGKGLFEASESTTQEHEGLRRCVTIRDGLHEDAWMQRQWLTEICDYIGYMRQKRRQGHNQKVD